MRLASCFKYLHKQNVVARRLKLESIVFSDSKEINELKLTDLFLFNFLENLQKEPTQALEEAFYPPKTSFQGDRKFIP